MARITLPILDARIAARALATRDAHPWWPCAEGCDHCCRSLPHLPVITRSEWERLRDALAGLSSDVRDAILRRAHEASASGPVTCPMLDRERAACLVYDARPIACRTYGFYTERDAGLHCNKVTTAVAEHTSNEPPEAHAIVWGNGEAIAADLNVFGKTASLLDWLRE